MTNSHNDNDDDDDNNNNNNNNNNKTKIIVIIIIIKVIIFARLYVPRHKGGRGLISCEGCIKGEANSLDWYVKRGSEPMLKLVSMKATVTTETGRIQENTDQRKRTSVEREKMRGQNVREMDENIDKDKTLGWLKIGDLKAYTEVLIYAA